MTESSGERLARSFQDVFVGANIEQVNLYPAIENVSPTVTLDCFRISQEERKIAVILYDTGSVDWASLNIQKEVRPILEAAQTVPAILPFLEENEEFYSIFLHPKDKVDTAPNITDLFDMFMKGVSDDQDTGEQGLKFPEEVTNRLKRTYVIGQNSTGINGAFAKGVLAGLKAKAQQSLSQYMGFSYPQSLEEALTLIKEGK